MAPPTSPVFMIPDVFVIPPDDESPSAPYCCFDAASSSQEILSNPPDPVSIQTALDMLEQSTNPAPVFHRSTMHQEDLVMPRKRYRKPAPQEPENDSDVVEVIKVRKRADPPLAGSEAPGVAPQFKTPTLKSRASKAFMSLKGMKKTSGGPKNHVADVFSAPDDEPAVTRSVSKRLRRPRSMNLEDNAEAKSATLGRGGTQLKRHGSISLSTMLTGKREPAPPASRGSSLDESFVQVSVPDETLGPFTPDVEPRCTSPLPPSESLDRPVNNPPNTTRRKFSVMGLQRFFSFSSSTLNSSAKSTPTPPPPPPTIIPEPAEPSELELESQISRDSEDSEEDCDDSQTDILPPELSSSPTTSGPAPQLRSLNFTGLGLDMTPTSSISSSPSPSDGEDEGPLTPTDERPRPSFSSTIRSRPSVSADTKRPRDDPNLEMRLDSLHFDDLSFDLEAF